MNAVTKKKKKNPSQPSILKKKNISLLLLLLFFFFFFGRWLLHLNVLIRNNDFVYLKLIITSNTSNISSNNSK